MGTSSTKNKKENEFDYNKYICKIKLDNKKVSGFLCDIRYLDQEELVPTIITYKDIFLKEFKIITAKNYIIERDDSVNFLLI